MSKVIQYLPTTIPRILLNCSVVHPPMETSCDVGESNNDDQSEDEVPEFRDGYCFDAHLLGYCDNVTRRLVDGIKQPRSDVEQNDSAGKLLSRIHQDSKDNNDNDGSNGDNTFDAALWGQHTTVPFDRVLLFPGAVCSTKPSTSSKETYTEVAHCDGCSKVIQGTLWKCLQCFDYDLCVDCHPKLGKDHFDGKHKFTKEILID